jgi:NAD(P)H-hydrate epimerase
MEVVTSGEMYRIEKETFEKTGLPPLTFMECAALKVFERGMEVLRGIERPKVVVAAGCGNNGGDGLAAARRFCLRGVEVSVVYLPGSGEVKPDAAINLKAVKNLNIPVIEYAGDDDCEAARVIKESDLVIDALLGIGLSRAVSPVYASLINIINENAKFVISVDMPSGVSADTGGVLGCAVKADVTVTFACYKAGLVLYPGTKYAGDVAVCDIGIPVAGDVAASGLSGAEGAAILPEREQNSNKGTFGKVYAVAGCEEMPGAAVLCALAAYKTGCGLVRVCSVKGVARTVVGNIPECVTSVLPDEVGYLCGLSYDRLKPLLSSANVVVLGPGLGAVSSVREFVCKMVSEAEVPMVIDADALNVLTPRLLRACDNSVITPHPMEMSRLTGIPLETVLSDTLNTAKNFAAEYNIVTLLKGARTVIAPPNGEVRINMTGNSALAKAGTGDVLSGIIGALMAQGLGAFDAASAGSFIHGMAGDMLSGEFGQYGVMAGDVAKGVPGVIRGILKL